MRTGMRETTALKSGNNKIIPSVVIEYKKRYVMKNITLMSAEKGSSKSHNPIKKLFKVN